MFTPQPIHESTWRIFEDLRDKTPAQLSDLLPYREERNYGSPDGVTERHALNTALDSLILIELAAQLGHENPPWPGGAAAEALDRLRQQPAFRSYVDSYFYFGVRMAASRFLPERPIPLGGQRNSIAFSLPHPPPLRCTDAAAAAWEQSFTRVRDRQGTFLEQAESSSAATRVRYRLWLRGFPEDGASLTIFKLWTDAVLAFASKAEGLYASLDPAVAARFALLDAYQLARLLGAHISPTGVVRFDDIPLLRELSRAKQPYCVPFRPAFRSALKTLSRVFDGTCDLIRNSVEIAQPVESRVKPSPPHVHTVDWRTVCDEELKEIEKQRGRRGLIRAQDPFRNGRQFADFKFDSQGWSWRVRDGGHVPDVVGLAISGGGIRSATLGLGVLQSLQQLDILRGVDYLSTVSGGGYIGAWLVANIQRSDPWLARRTEWDASVQHLREHADYLAPRTGLLSLDTWTIWGTYVRNAFLIQLSAFAALACLLIAIRLAVSPFMWAGRRDAPWIPADWTPVLHNGSIVVIFAMVLLAVSVGLNIRKSALRGDADPGAPWRRSSAVFAFAVVPALLSAFLIGAALFEESLSAPAAYSEIVTTFWHRWWPSLTALLAAHFTASILSLSEIEASWKWLTRIAGGFLIALTSVSVVYLALCGIVLLLAGQTQGGLLPSHAQWFALVSAPPLVLFANMLGIAVLIGLTGPASGDARREWWTRYGSRLGLWLAGIVILSVAAVYGPLWILLAGAKLTTQTEWAVLSWIGTVAGGLFAGNSSNTDGQGEQTLKSRAISLFAKFAAFAFIVGALLGASTLVHILLTKLFTNFNPLSAADYWQAMSDLTYGSRWGISGAGAAFVAVLVIASVLSWRVDINVFGLSQFYRNRLVRCYLGASRWTRNLRNPHPVTNFDEGDELLMTQFATLDPEKEHVHDFRGPFPIINCAVNLGGSDDLAVRTRMSASFTITPLRVGAARPAIGYAATGTYASGMVKLGQAISTSGAAASPNMGYHTSTLIAFLLTLFNVRLGWWFPNPGQSRRRATNLGFSTWYLGRELFGMAGENSGFVNVSDGGHFENLGIYELVRRRCKIIIASDGEADPNLTFGSLGSVIRMCETDFGAKISIDTRPIQRDPNTKFSSAHCAMGEITYANGSRGRLIYLKSSLTGDEEPGISQYHADHPEFPHQPTSDQFFSEDQFEAYRLLGQHICKEVFAPVTGNKTLLESVDHLARIWSPSINSDAFVRQAETLIRIWETIRKDSDLHPLWHELDVTAAPSTTSTHKPTEAQAQKEQILCFELIQFMENVYQSLRLDDEAGNIDNAGWMALFEGWAKSPTFRKSWRKARGLYGGRFAFFCHQQLGLPVEL
jgi:hypothetical protein